MIWPKLLTMKTNQAHSIDQAHESTHTQRTQTRTHTYTGEGNDQEENERTQRRSTRHASAAGSQASNQASNQPTHLWRWDVLRAFPAAGSLGAPTQTHTQTHNTPTQGRPPAPDRPPAPCTKAGTHTHKHTRRRCLADSVAQSETDCVLTKHTHTHACMHACTH